MQVKPHEYGNCYVLTEDVHYETVDLAQKGSQASTGTLSVGRVVWIERDSSGANHPVRAYVEGIGIVSIDSRSLKKST